MAWSHKIHSCVSNGTTPPPLPPALQTQFVWFVYCCTKLCGVTRNSYNKDKTDGAAATNGLLISNLIIYNYNKLIGCLSAAYRFYLIFDRNVNMSSDSFRHVIFSGLDKYCIPQYKEPQGPSKSKPLQNEVKQENCETIYGSRNCKSKHFKTVYCTK